MGVDASEEHSHCGHNESTHESCSQCERDSPHHHHRHRHDDRVSSISVEVKGEMDTDLVNEWLLSTLQEKHQDLYRMKGIVALKGFEEKFVFQGVHAEFDGRPHEPWKEGEERKSKIVFIGKDL